MKLASSALDFYTNTNSLPASYNPFFYLFRVATRSLYVSEVYVDMVLDEAGVRLVEL